MVYQNKYTNNRSNSDFRGGNQKSYDGYDRYNGNGGFRSKPEEPETKIEFKELSIDSYVDSAEELIKSYMKSNNKTISTSQIRNILAMTSDILNKINSCSQNEISDEIVQSLNYLRIRTVYDSGREPSVKNFVKSTYLLKHLKSVMSSKKKTDVELFCHYVESLVAFFKFNGGKD